MVVGLLELLHHLQQKKQKRPKRHVVNETVMKVEVHDQIPIIYPVQRCYQPLKDRKSYSQHPNSSMLTMNDRKQRVILPGLLIWKNGRNQTYYVYC